MRPEGCEAQRRGGAQKANDLGKSPMGPLILRMTAPVMLAQVVNALYNIINRVYIGHIPQIGETALAGLGVTFPVIMLITAMQSLVSVGGSTKAAIAMGEGKKDEAERILGTSTLLLVVLALVLTGVFQVIKTPMLLLFGASENTIGYASEYLGIYLWGTTMMMLSLGLNAFIAAQGFTTFSMATTLIGALLNIVLDPIFIFLFDMKVPGAAVGTVVSQTVTALWVLHFLIKRGTLRLRFKNLRFDRRIIVPVLAVGLAPFFMQSTECLLGIVFNASLQHYGGDVAVSAFAIASSATQTMVMLFNGFTMGILPIVSYNYGAGNGLRVRQAARAAIGVTAVMGVVLWFVLELWPEVFVLLFNGEQELVSYTVWAIRIYAAGFCVLGVQHSCQHVMIALEQTRVSLFLALLRKFMLLIPMIYVLPHFMQDKVLAVLIAEPIADVLAACATGIVFFFSLKKILRRFDAKRTHVIR